MKITKNNKIIYLEVLRLIAIIFVIFNHTSNDGFLLFSSQQPNSLTYWIYAFFSVFCKFAVPIFFMISGILYLKKDDLDLKYLFKKRILKMIIILIIFSLIIFCNDVYINEANFSLKLFLKSLITCNISVTMWFLYMYIIFLLLLPLLKMIANQINIKMINYLILLAILFDGVLPCIYFLLFKETLVYNSFLSPVWSINIIFIYPLIGYFLNEKITINNPKKKLIILWIINFILIIITNLITYYQSKITGNIEEQTFYNCFVIINAITIFLTSKVLLNNTKYIQSLGKYTFGIYLIHVVIIKLSIFQKLIISFKNLNINSGLFAILLTLLIYLISLIITFILSKIPILKKLVGF